MKYLLVVGDGMADFPVEELGGKTPMEYVCAPSMARAAGGRLGRVRTCPEGMPPGSDVAFLSLMGHDPGAVYRGRSPLEAAGEGVALREGEISFRMNLISLAGDYDTAAMASYNGDGIEGEDARVLVEDLLKNPAFAALTREADMIVTPTDTFRHIAVMPGRKEDFVLTPPHDIAGQGIAAHLPRGERGELLSRLQRTAFDFLSTHPVNLRRRARGRLPANGVWLWGAGSATELERFEGKYHKKGSVISAVPLVRGIAWLSGLRVPRVPGATGTLETNYAGKVEAAIGAFRAGDDFVLLHLEAPDDLSHLGDVQGKVEAIRRLDERMISPMMAALEDMGEDYRMLVMPDHYTLLSTMTHDGTPVPFALYDSRFPGKARPFTEAACAGESVLETGDALLNLLFCE